MAGRIAGEGIRNNNLKSLKRTSTAGKRGEQRERKRQEERRRSQARWKDRSRFVRSTLAVTRPLGKTTWPESKRG